jgi:hypothetical protein
MQEILDKPAVRPCATCGKFVGVLYRSAMTAYHFEGERGSDDDPNPKLEG